MSDEIISSLDEMIQRWIVAEREIKFLGQTHRQSSGFLSLTHKDVTEREISFINGGFAIDSIDNEKAVFADVYFGDEQGLGRGVVGATDVPIPSSALKRSIDAVLDLTLKLATEHYLEQVGVSQTSKEKNIFYSLSRENVIKSKSTVPVRDENLLSDENIREIERFSERLYKNPYVEKVSATMRFKDITRRFVNSEGTEIRSTSFRGVFLAGLFLRTANSELIEYTLPLHYFISPSKVKRFNYYSEVRTKKILEHIDVLANAKPIDTGEYPVILDGAALGVFFHEAIAAHLLSGKHIYQNQSNVFADKIGKQIMPEFLSVIDDPAYRSGFGHYVYDEEGVRGQKTTLVENGVLKNFLLDRHSAGYLNLQSNGHARCEGIIGEDFRNGRLNVLMPEPRISNLFVESSMDLSEDDLIRLMREYCERTNREFGLYVKQGSGQVNIQTGQFFLYPGEAYKIYTDGKVELTSGINLMGDPYSILNEIVACSNRYAVRFGFCGAESGFVPTWERAPSAFFENVLFNKEIRERVTDRTIPKYI
ncbi:MAG: TldD/PmbA family protein [Nanoarchaeota archaeon]|nr:TldD/PmbA family protein [Nanoarchaeota archaeon]MBU1322375.1 TldD/PmbA family protein [Nanoarchaeota archaeon]MBU1598402.1 TldD/PmbA family protein [Nanoarchaeota archaeon]MBU2440779.1 TldD/PmbA family protein [Nanoarchaeota archaeon]